MLELAVNLSSPDKIENVENPGRYGFDEPLHTIQFAAKDAEYTFEIGDYNDIAGIYYLRRKGEKDIYTVSGTVKNAFSATLEELTVQSGQEQTDTQ